MLPNLLYIVLSHYHRHSVASHSAITAKAVCGTMLPIDGSLRLESQNVSTFHTIGSVAPHTAIVVMPMISIVARRYNTTLQRPPQLLIKPKQKCIKAPRNYFEIERDKAL
jgi:hypothetical protein